MCLKLSRKGFAPIIIEMRQNPSIAFVVPCLNEELTVAHVVQDCRKHIPAARVYVFDNNSTDQTATFAKDSGAIVVPSPRPGKGEVIRHAFAELHEDILIVLDGDGTYPASIAPAMVDAITGGYYDMAVCVRKSEQEVYPRFHRFGNRLFSWMVSFLAGNKVSDVFSGYRAVSREFYETVALDSRGFEIEAELTLKAHSREFHVKEINGHYGRRPAGSYSKLRTFRDGFRILKFIFLMMRDCRPLPFFTLAAAGCFFLSLIAGAAPIMDYMEFQYVYTVPRAILAASLMVMAMVLSAVGLILDSQIRHLREQSKLIRKWMARHSTQDKEKNSIRLIG